MKSPRKKCPHCKGTIFISLQDVTLRLSFGEYGQAEVRGIADLGTQLYMLRCEKCDTPVERNELINDERVRS